MAWFMTDTKSELSKIILLTVRLNQENANLKEKSKSCDLNIKQTESKPQSVRLHEEGKFLLLKISIYNQNTNL